MQPPVLLQSAVFLFVFCFLSVTFWNTAQRAVIHTLFLAHFFSSWPLLPFTVIKLMMVCHVSWSALHSANLWSCNSPIWHGDHCKPCHNMNQNYDPRLILSWSWIFSVTGSGSCPVFHKKVKHKRLGYFLLEWTVLEPLWTFDLTTSFKINLGNGVIVVAGGFWKVGNREPLFPVAPRFSTRPQ